MIVRCYQCGRQLLLPAGAQGNCPGCGAALSAVGPGMTAAAATAPTAAVSADGVQEPAQLAEQRTPSSPREATGESIFYGRRPSRFPDLDEHVTSWQDIVAEWANSPRVWAVLAGVLLIAGVGYGWSKLSTKRFPSVQRWEYKFASVPGPRLIIELAASGGAGWDLVFAQQVPGGDGKYELIFKRPIIVAPDAVPSEQPAASEAAGKTPAAAVEDGSASPSKSDLRKFDDSVPPKK